MTHFFEDNSSSNSADSKEKENESPKQFCYCRKGEVGSMIACDNPDCPVEWFHWTCVGVTTEPDGAWFCPDCKLVLRKF